jgi:seryl-tRNA synthetase
MKSGQKEAAAALLKQKETLVTEKANLEKTVTDKEALLNSKLNAIGNIVHDSCIVSETEDENAVVGGWWPEGISEETERARRASLLHDATDKSIPGLSSHHQVLYRLEGYVRITILCSIFLGRLNV